MPSCVLSEFGWLTAGIRVENGPVKTGIWLPSGHPKSMSFHGAVCNFWYRVVLSDSFGSFPIETDGEGGGPLRNLVPGSISTVAQIEYPSWKIVSRSESSRLRFQLEDGQLWPVAISLRFTGFQWRPGAEALRWMQRINADLPTVIGVVSIRPRWLNVLQLGNGGRRGGGQLNGRLIESWFFFLLFFYFSFFIILSLMRLAGDVTDIGNLSGRSSALTAIQTAIGTTNFNRRVDRKLFNGGNCH